MLAKTISKNICVLVLVGLAGCAGMQGAYRGPESFGKAVYNVSAPPVTLSRRIRVVVLTFKDERPRHKGLDWVRQSEKDDTGQPKEIRVEFKKALQAGFSKHPKIQLLSREEFLKTKKADLIISGKVVKLEAQRLPNIFKGSIEYEVLFQDSEGNLVRQSKPHTVRAYENIAYNNTGYYDEIPVGSLGQLMTRLIEDTVRDFLKHQAVTGTLAEIDQAKH